jgi:hypothetical protein
MRRLRSYFEGDRENSFAVPTAYRTPENRNELFCSMCGESFFVDDLVFADVSRVIEKTLENPFVCEACLDEYEELARGH